MIYAHRRHTVWFARVVLFMPRPAQDPQENHLLAALSPLERERLYPLLRLVPMPLGEVLYESGDILRDVYFSTDSIASSPGSAATGLKLIAAVRKYAASTQSS